MCTLNVALYVDTPNILFYFIEPNNFYPQKVIENYPFFFVCSFVFAVISLLRVCFEIKLHTYILYCYIPKGAFQEK